MTSGELVEASAKFVFVFPFMLVSRTSTGNSFAGATSIRFKTHRNKSGQGVRSGPFEGHPAFVFFIFSFFHFSFFVFLKKSFFFAFFFETYFIASIGLRVLLWMFPPCSVLHGDVVSWRHKAGLLGLGWATCFGESMLQLPERGGGSSPN